MISTALKSAAHYHEQGYAPVLNIHIVWLGRLLLHLVIPRTSGSHRRGRHPPDQVGVCHCQILKFNTSPLGWRSAVHLRNLLDWNVPYGPAAYESHPDNPSGNDRSKIRGLAATRMDPHHRTPKQVPSKSTRSPNIRIDGKSSFGK